MTGPEATFSCNEEFEAVWASKPATALASPAAPSADVREAVHTEQPDPQVAKQFASALIIERTLRRLTVDVADDAVVNASRNAWASAADKVVDTRTRVSDSTSASMQAEQPEPHDDRHEIPDSTIKKKRPQIRTVDTRSSSTQRL